MGPADPYRRPLDGSRASSQTCLHAPSSCEPSASVTCGYYSQRPPGSGASSSTTLCSSSEAWSAARSRCTSRVIEPDAPGPSSTGASDAAQETLPNREPDRGRSKSPQRGALPVEVSPTLPVDVSPDTPSSTDARSCFSGPSKGPTLPIDPQDLGTIRAQLAMIRCTSRYESNATKPSALGLVSVSSPTLAGTSDREYGPSDGAKGCAGRERGDERGEHIDRGDDTLCESEESTLFDCTETPKPAFRRARITRGPCPDRGPEYVPGVMMQYSSTWLKRHPELVTRSWRDTNVDIPTQDVSEAGTELTWRRDPAHVRKVMDEIVKEIVKRDAELGAFHKRRYKSEDDYLDHMAVQMGFGPRSTDEELLEIALAAETGKLLPHTKLGDMPQAERFPETWRQILYRWVRFKRKWRKAEWWVT